MDPDEAGGGIEGEEGLPVTGENDTFVVYQQEVRLRGRPVQHVICNHIQRGRCPGAVQGSAILHHLAAAGFFMRMADTHTVPPRDRQRKYT